MVAAPAAIFALVQVSPTSARAKTRRRHTDVGETCIEAEVVGSKCSP
jgi:hypothetical protein